MRVEYELDQWEWQGTIRSIDVDPEDYRDMSAEEIKQAVYEGIREDAEQNLHFVYDEDGTLAQITESLKRDTDEEANEV